MNTILYFIGYIPLKSLLLPSGSHTFFLLFSRAEIPFRLHKIFFWFSGPFARAENISPVCYFQPGLNPSPCNRQFDFKRICFRGRAEVSTRLTGLKFQPGLKYRHVKNRAFSYDGSYFASSLEISVEEKIQRGYPWKMGQLTVIYRATAVHKFPLNSLRNQWIAFLCKNNHSIYVLMTVTAAALWELTWLILINQLKFTGLQNNRDAAANFGCSWNFNRVNVRLPWRLTEEQ